MFKRGLNKIIFQITWVGRVILTKLGIKRRYKIDGVSIKLDYTHRLTDYQKYMRFYDRFLPHFIQYLPSKSTVVDIGANVGDTLVAMVSKKSDLEYVCIEADLKFYEDLVDNLSILKKQNKYRGGKVEYIKDIGTDGYLVDCEKQKRELNLILGLRQKGTKLKDIKSFMEKYTGRKWWISFIHKLIKRYEDDYFIENEEIIRNQICQVEMERSICDV